MSGQEWTGVDVDLQRLALTLVHSSKIIAFCIMLSHFVAEHGGQQFH
jgi:uncharacterized protein YunC (DUF1805 family)